MTIVRTMARLLSVTVVVIVAACYHDQQSHIEFNRQSIVGPLNERLLALLQVPLDQSDERCISTSQGVCALVTAPAPLSPCPIWEKMDNCRAIMLRVSVFRIPTIENLLRNETDEFCTFRRDPQPPEEFTTTIGVVGCHPPSEHFYLVYRQRPTICVVLVGDAPNQTPVEMFALRDGQHVEHHWCNVVFERAQRLGG